MKLPDCSELILELVDGVIHITLNRPHKRNAMNSLLVDELMAVLDAVAEAPAVRVLVLRGADGNFCAGGDISGMQIDSNQADAGDATWLFNRSFGHLISKMNRAPQLVISLLEGAVLGGGFGLACVSDLAIADRDAVFAMPETGLGIIPAQIAPFVVARVGLTQARRLALLGERLDGVSAQQLGLVHHLTDGGQQMRDKLNESLALIKRCAPRATAVTKQLLLDSAQNNAIEALLDRAADDFSNAINSDEGREGTRAFMEKRKPGWAV
ncbi:MAG: enoyl-CoA hydratase/isomerase family protein [Gammaproteobacteria bacterium]|nr:enoyl-CoA hydratase/isomerase family protein [Gammaproteobacteria bacterium]